MSATEPRSNSPEDIASDGFRSPFVYPQLGERTLDHMRTSDELELRRLAVTAGVSLEAARRFILALDDTAGAALLRLIFREKNLRGFGVPKLGNVRGRPRTPRRAP